MSTARTPRAPFSSRSFTRWPPMKPPAPQTRNVCPLIFMNVRSLSETWLRGLIVTNEIFARGDERDGVAMLSLGEVGLLYYARTPKRFLGSAAKHNPAARTMKPRLVGCESCSVTKLGQACQSSSQASNCWRLAPAAAANAILAAIHTRYARKENPKKGPDSSTTRGHSFSA